MTNLAKYHARSPRYILRTEDNSLIRVAGPFQTPWEESTSIQNVSLTGLAFVAQADLCPSLGEVIKIQFSPPALHQEQTQNKQIACYAIVSRLDRINQSCFMVAVHFYKMDMGHRVALAQSLTSNMKQAEELRQKHFSLLLPQILFLTGIGLLWIMFFYFQLTYVRW